MQPKTHITDAHWGRKERLVALGITAAVLALLFCLIGGLRGEAASVTAGGTCHGYTWAAGTVSGVKAGRLYDRVTVTVAGDTGVIRTAPGAYATGDAVQIHGIACGGWFQWPLRVRLAQ